MHDEVPPFFSFSPLKKKGRQRRRCGHLKIKFSGFFSPPFVLVVRLTLIRIVKIRERDGVLFFPPSFLLTPLVKAGFGLTGLGLKGLILLFSLLFSPLNQAPVKTKNEV